MLGSISGDTFNKVISTAKRTGSTSEWLTAEFNTFRGLSGTGTGTSAGENTADNTETSKTSLGTLINNQRTADGIHELTYNSSMQDLADIRAKELATSFSHTRPDGTNPPHAEIIYSGSASSQSAFNWFYDSTSHKSIMLSENYSTYAIGTYQSNGRNYWVVLFN